MAGLAGEAVGAVVEQAADDEAASDAGAERDQERVRGALPGPRHHLGPRRAGGVVVEHDREGEGLDQRGTQLLADQALQVGSAVEDPVGADESRQADADADDGPQAPGVDLVEHVAGGADDGVERLRAGGGGHAVGREDGRGVVGVDGGGEHLGAADVHPDGECHRVAAQYRSRAPMRPITSRSAFPTHTSTWQP